jgi:hypothetical protein
MHAVRVSQAADCVMALTVLEATQSGGNKFKLTGVIVSEEAGGSVRQTAGGVNYAHDIAGWAPLLRPWVHAWPGAAAALRSFSFAGPAGPPPACLYDLRCQPGTAADRQHLCTPTAAV